MDFADLFSTAVRQLRHNPWLWVLGLIYALPGFFLSHALTPATSLNPDTLNTWFSQLAEPDPALLETQLIPIFEAVSDVGQVTRFVVGLTAVLLLVWIITTLAEAGLILIVSRAQTNQPPLGVRALFTDMRHLLWRLIAIDTILFFPLFAVLLTAELMVLAVLASILFGGTFDLQAVAGQLALGMLCFLSLLCLAAPVGLVTVLFRLVAFRVAAVENLPTRPSIRRAWQLLKQKWLTFFLIGLVLIIIQLVGEGLAQLLSAPLAALAPWLTALITLPVTAVLTAFDSTAWTVAYAMSNEQKNG